MPFNTPLSYTLRSYHVPHYLSHHTLTHSHTQTLPPTHSPALHTTLITRTLIHRATRRLIRSSHLSNPPSSPPHTQTHSLLPHPIISTAPLLTYLPPPSSHSLTHTHTHSFLHRATRPLTRSSAVPWRATPLPGCTPPSTPTPPVGWTQALFTPSQVVADYNNTTYTPSFSPPLLLLNSSSFTSQRIPSRSLLPPHFPS